MSFVKSVSKQVNQRSLKRCASFRCIGNIKLKYIFIIMAFLTFVTLFSLHFFRQSTSQIISYDNEKLEVSEVLNKLNPTQLHADYMNFMKPRVSGTTQNLAIANFIANEMNNIGLHVQTLSHYNDVPVRQEDLPKFLQNHEPKASNIPGYSYQPIKFNNIVAETMPNAGKTLTLACHFDSKYRLELSEYRKLRLSENSEIPDFLGATDSAIPCGMLISIARTLVPIINCQNSQKKRNISLQFLFFDGEEAFYQWSHNDSLYGSRYVASVFEQTFITLPDTQTKIAKIKTITDFVLLDLIGEPNTAFCYFSGGSNGYFKLSDIENKLRQRIQFRPTPYFQRINCYNMVADDHIPFQNLGVPIIHIISSPFPKNWHQFSDDGTNIDAKTVEEITKILIIFVTEYLNLDITKYTLNC